MVSSRSASASALIRAAATWLASGSRAAHASITSITDAVAACSPLALQAN